MAEPKRSILATIVGWLIVAVLGWWLLGVVLGTLRWVIRSILVVALLLGLLWLYLSLKVPSDDDE